MVTKPASFDVIFKSVATVNFKRLTQLLCMASQFIVLASIPWHFKQAGFHTFK